MNRRKPKPKRKQKAKGKPKQQPSKAAKPALPYRPSAEIERAIGLQRDSEEVAGTVEIQVEIENPAARVELRDEIAESVSAIEKPVEIENSADSVELRDETANSASSDDMRSETEHLESIFEIQVEIENPASAAEIRDASGNPAGPLENYDGAEIPTIPLGIPVVREKPGPHLATPTGVDRRAHPRYAFTAAVEVVAAELGARIKTQVRDLSQQGCYVDTSKPLALGTNTDVRITKGAIAFEARARVVFNQAGKGMGLMFIAVEPEHRKTLDTWIAESRESSWRAANRRRSQRVLMKVPVQVSGQTANEASFEERTHTLSISAHGALIALETPVHRGQRFILSNMQTKAALECVVVYLERIPGEPMHVGVDFMLPNPTFWRVAFPPKDWTPRHPDAKSVR
jgi:c-di-GMP-binding flagellar brake protein YcgR